jgi:NAD(P)-dependent dehydrogenase (short-subunit alcohol dehydrogenase family)
MHPIGGFSETDFDAWVGSVELNLLNQLRFVHRMLPYRRPAMGRHPLCLFLAGGGVNSAPPAFSAYTVAKIALIKATELLDAEESDVAFTILGPGWVRTNIHEQTISAAGAPEAIVRETRRRLEADDFLPMSRVLEAVDWLIEQPKEVIGGRNFSAAGDPFGAEELVDFLIREPSAFRLRRAFNNSMGVGRGA